MFGIVRGRAGTTAVGSVSGSGGMPLGAVVPTSSMVAASGSSGSVTVAGEALPSVDLAGTLSQEVASMIGEAASATAGAGDTEGASEEGANEEQRRIQEEQQQQGGRADEAGGQPRRGDGQVLRERDEKKEPRNPKKRAMDTEEEQRGKDEL